MTTIPQPDRHTAPWWQVPAIRGPSQETAPAGGRLEDAALFAFAVLLGGIAQGYLWRSHGVVLDAVDVAAGVVACLALWWRRGHPMAVFVLAFASNTFSPLALGAGLVALCTAASRVRGRAVIAVAVLTAVASIVFPVVNPSAGEIVQVGFPAFLLTVIAFGWGLYLRARRELVASLRERAERLEADQQRSAEEAREAERRRIAREMHDVLAHRLSLLSVHAGALEFHPGASPTEIAEAAGVIRTAAADALGDLRQIITVLREDSVAADGPPQPGFGLLADLIQESRSAGMTLDERVDLPDVSRWPAAVERTVYRVVQEGLTNARKHAPGAPVLVTVTADGQAVTAEVVSRRRPVAAGPGAAGPGAAGPGAAGPGVAGPGAAGPGAQAGAGAGAGLIGLAERVTLAGGQLEHGPNAIGDFVLRATIPEQP
jgi:signal transduction histidine kinase